MTARRFNKISGQFSARLIEMLESPSYRVLSLAGHRLIARIEVELAHHGGQDNGRLPVTFDDFEEFGIDRHSIAPAQREAEALGLAVITERGRKGKANRRAPNYFRLTYRPTKGLPGDGTHEWRTIATMDRARELAKAARQKTDSPVGENTKDSGDSPLQKPRKPVKSTLPKPVKTPTTIYISGEDTAQTPREARPPGSAEASGAASDDLKQIVASTMLAERAERPETIQNRIAIRLGGRGWEVLQSLPEEELQLFTDLEQRGELDDAALADLRLKHLAARKEAAA